MVDQEIVWIDIQLGMRMVKRYVLEDFKCKYCDSSNLVLYSKYQDKQRQFCKDCKRKFAQNTVLPKMKSPVTHVASAVQQYYNCMSLNAVCRNIEQQYNYKPANSTIYRWVAEFTKRAIADTKDIKPKVGDKWVADETYLKVGGGKQYISTPELPLVNLQLWCYN